MTVLKDADAVRIGNADVKSVRVGNNLAWLKENWLLATIGTVSTPYTTDMAIKSPVCITMKIRADYDVGPAGDRFIQGQWGGSTASAVYFIGARATGLLVGRYDAAGNRLDYTAMNLAEMQAAIPRGKDVLIGVRIEPGPTTPGISGIKSIDGTTWSQVRKNSSAAWTMRDGAVPISVGTHIINTLSWIGRIYWAEMRTGLDPNAGTIVWRFDANDYKGPTTRIFNNVLNADSNADGIANGWVAQVSATPPVNGVRSMIDGHQRITGAMAASTHTYGIRLPTRLPVVAGRHYSCQAKLAGVASVQSSHYINFQWYNSAGTYLANTGTAPFVITTTPTNYYIGATPPANAVTVDVVINEYGLASANGTSPFTLDIYDVRVVENPSNNYTDPRGRVWTFTNGFAIQPV